MASAKFISIALLFVYYGGTQQITQLPKEIACGIDSFDFVIVGAGSAGCVLANRLSENSSVNLLVIEAGDQEDPILNEIPAEAPFLLFTERDWQYKTEKQTAPVFAGSQPIFNWSRGKVLGGTSSFNWMMYVRGNKRDFDEWSKVLGRDWQWKNILPYFLKSEDYRVQTEFNPEYHHKGGCLTVEQSKSKYPITATFLAAGEELKYPTRDFNGPIQTGIMETELTMRNCTRCSSNKAFLEPASKRKNVCVLTKALATKIMLANKNSGLKCAMGVQFQMADKTYTVSAKKEVILSAGAINSPQLLMLSGIGPAAHLKEKQIQPIVDLPGVGENLQDHLAVAPFSFTKKGPDGQGNCPVTSDFQRELHQWVNTKSGLLCRALIPVTGFVSTPLVDETEDWPDIQLAIMNLAGGVVGEQAARAMNAPIEFYKAFLEPVGTDIAFTMTMLVLRPKSRGNILLRDNNPTTPPIIDPRYYSEPGDVRAGVEGMKIVVAFNNTETFKAAGIKIRENDLPFCQQFEKYSDAHLQCMVGFSSIHAFHPVGTCKMSTENDPMGVVDPKFNVRGVQNLRVIDASIMPNITSGNTNAPTIMFGELGSDFIKKRWNL